jgi:hypothetical protein
MMLKRRKKRSQLPRIFTKSSAITPITRNAVSAISRALCARSVVAEIRKWSVSIIRSLRSDGTKVGARPDWMESYWLDWR